MIAVGAVSKNNGPAKECLLLYPHNRRLGGITVNSGELTDLAEDLQMGKLFISEFPFPAWQSNL